MKRRSAFTLIELLTVMAISAILLTLIVVPVIQSFNLTRMAQAFADAQDKGRTLTERISREINNAVSVRGASARILTSLNGNQVQTTPNSLVVQVPALGANGKPQAGTPATVEVLLPNVKLDLVRAAEGSIDPTLGLGQFRDPVSGKIDPTLKNPKGQVNLPTGVGQTLVRYFVALRDPFSSYNNPYDGLMMAMGGGRDNLFVLYRAVVQPKVFRSVNPRDGSAATMMYVNNVDYFDADPNTIVGTDVVTNLPVGQPLLDDPRFFIPDSPLKADRIRNWLGLGANNTVLAKNTSSPRAVVQTEVSRYDMIQPVYNIASRQVTVDAITATNYAPRLIPLIQFRPERISNDPATGQVAVRPGEENAGTPYIAPDVYMTQLAMWSNPVVRTWPNTYNAGSAATDKYLVGRFDPSNGTGVSEGTWPYMHFTKPQGFSVYYYDPEAPGGSSDDYLSGVELFDEEQYERAASNGLHYAFTQAVQAANSRSGWLSDPNMRSAFTPYYLDSQRGKIIASFGIGEVGDITTNPGPNFSNLPTAWANPVGATVAYSPNDDPNIVPNVPGTWTDNTFSTINEKFNKIFSMWQNDGTNVAGLHNVDQARLQRFIDLRVTPNADGTPSPLLPGQFPKIKIVPGSETIVGPDQLPGPNLGQPIRYTRVGINPGPNQYRINYTDLPEPWNSSTGSIDYGIIGLGSAAIGSFTPTSPYDQNNLVSAVFQPQYKVGYVQFDSDPGTPLPAPSNPIQINYRFQFVGAQVVSGPDPSAQTAPRYQAGQQHYDVFGVDYDSRQLMAVLLTIRNYPQVTLVPNPQTVTLKATASVRNYIR